MNYQMPEETTGAAISEILEKHYRVIEEPAGLCTFTYYDSFDWRFHNQGLYLLNSGGKFSFINFLEDPETEETSLQTKYHGRFSWDYPLSGFREYMSAILDPRALSAIIQGTNKITTFHLLNKDEKTIARVTVEEASILKGNAKLPLKKRVCLHSVRGYEKALMKVQKSVGESGLKLIDESIFEEAIRILGITPGDYSGKIRFQISPETPARETVKTMISSLLEIARLNESGIIADHDSEYLHDYRVCVRKIRSILSLIKDVFPEELTIQLKEDFRNLGTQTGPVRDLDVYLLSKDAYISMVPDAYKHGIELLFKDLEKRRKSEFTKLHAFLKSGPYHDQMAEIMHFFSHTEDELPDTGNSAKTIGTLAFSILQRRYAKIIAMGKHIITRKVEDEEVHQLRIECKKLRYLLEFFQSLLRKKSANRFVKQLKHLQDNLGRFNDLCVQQAYMNNYLKTITTRRRNGLEIMTAVGTLIGVLYKEQIEEKAKVETNVEAFICEENQELFNSIFSTIS